MCEALMAEWLEHMVHMPEVSDLIPRLDGPKNFSVHREFSNYVSFYRVSKDSSSILLNTRYKYKNNTATFLTKTLHVRNWIY